MTSTAATSSASASSSSSVSTTTSTAASTEDKDNGLAKLLGHDKCIDNVGEEYSLSSFKGPVALYFSAHWCGPCRQFTPELAKLYKDIKKAHSEFEIIFISWDQSEVDWNDYFSTMPWKGIPFNKQWGAEIGRQLNVKGVPTLLLVKDGKIYNREGRAALTIEGLKGYPWEPKRVNSLATGARDFNEKPCLISFISKLDKAGRDAVHKELAAIGANSKYDSVSLMFEEENDALASRIRGFVGLKADPALVYTEVKKGITYVDDSKEIKDGSITAFLDKSLKHELTVHIKSADRPKDDADPNHPGITIVTANSFDEIVLNKEKDVFLDVWASWCGPCMMVKPHIQRAAEVLHQMKSAIVIATLDSDANSKNKKYIPETYIPVLKLFNKTNKDKPVVWEVQRPSAAALLEFLNKNVSTENKFDVAEAKKLVTVFDQEEKKKIEKGVKDRVAAKKCTFQATGRTLAPQKYYACATCDPSMEATICESCKDTCHKGHAVLEETFGPSACDCGADNFETACKCSS